MVSGVELRLFPLYYLPIFGAAWLHGRVGALGVAILCTWGWVLANRLAGMEFSHDWIWLANTFTQGSSFVVVGWLAALLRDTILRERTLGRTDSLTRLLNGPGFYETARGFLETCHQRSTAVTLAYLDLDHFKVVNDLRGHAAGDELIRETGALFAEVVAEDGVGARLGGDEFALLLAGGPDEAARVLDGLRKRVAALSPEGGPRIGVSIGAVTFYPPFPGLDRMVQTADEAMYTAKRSGRDRLHTLGRPAPADGADPQPDTGSTPPRI